MKKYIKIFIVLLCFVVIVCIYQYNQYNNKYVITITEAEQLSTVDLVQLAIDDPILYNYAIASASVFRYQGVINQAEKQHPYLSVLISRSDCFFVLNEIEPTDYKQLKNKQALIWHLSQNNKPAPSQMAGAGFVWTDFYVV